MGDEGLLGVARDIAASNETPLRVMAGPGTGKSFALKRRVARLLEEGADPTRILAVTFTRNAAANLVEDLQNLGVIAYFTRTMGTMGSGNNGVRPERMKDVGALQPCREDHDCIFLALCTM